MRKSNAGRPEGKDQKAANNMGEVFKKRYEKERVRKSNAGRPKGKDQKAENNMGGVFK